jgi:hypothetical protein
MMFTRTGKYIPLDWNEVVGAGADRLMLFLAYIVEEDPTGFLRDLITGFFLETAYSGY